MDQLNKQYFNKQYFTKKDLESGQLTEFVEALISLGLRSETFSNEILISPEDCDLIRVNWVQTDKGSPENFGSFKFVDIDQVVATEYILPDGKSYLTCSEQEQQELFNEWLEQHPTWKQNDFGRWYDAAEAEAFYNSTKGQR